MTIMHIMEATAGDTTICHENEAACFEASEATSKNAGTLSIRAI